MIQKAYDVMQTMVQRTADQQPASNDAFDAFGSMVAAALREFDTKMPQLRHRLQLNIQKAVYEAQDEFYRFEYESAKATTSAMNDDI